MFNRKYWLPVLSILCLAICVFAFVSCENAKTEQTLTITDEYQIIRSEMAGQSITKSMVALSDALKGLGIQTTLGTDWIDRKGVADFPEQECEVLIGLTNRAESQAAYEELGMSGFTVRVVGKKIIAVGKDDFSTQKAVEYLMEHYFSADSDGRIPADLCYMGTTEYLYTYKFTPGANQKWDDVVTAASLQGLFNRESGKMVYMVSTATKVTGEVLQLMTEDDRWLSEYNQFSIGSLKDFLSLTLPYIKCVVLWDVNVPATVNVATTVAGVEDGIILTQKQYDTYKNEFFKDLPVIDLQNRFNGSVTGSAKNDAYAWAIDEYLKTGRCSTDYLCSYEDSYNVRELGNIRYAVARDWAIYQRAFVFDLSIWEDEVPKDDMNQTLGLDRQTYLQILRTFEELRGSEKLTEIDGFFSADKYSDSGNNEVFTSKYKGTQAEWEYAYAFSEYGFYWNPVLEYAHNMSFHQKAFPIEKLSQNRPRTQLRLDDNENMVYIMIMMGDYDSAGSVYTKMIANWKDAGRGEIPLAWSVNPNVAKEYPDILSYFYETATPNDYFVTNAGAAGWFTPSRVPNGKWQLYIDHNSYFFDLFDISCAPDFWDYQTFTPEIEKNIGQFATTGFGCLVSNQLQRGTGKKMTQHISAEGIPVDPLYNGFIRDNAASCGKNLAEGVLERARDDHATFMAFRAIWSTPTYLISCINALKEEMPNKNIQVVDPYTYYRLLEESLNNQ